MFIFSNKICPYNFYIKYFIMNIIIINWAILFENCHFSFIFDQFSYIIDQIYKESVQFSLKNVIFLLYLTNFLI